MVCRQCGAQVGVRKNVEKVIDVIAHVAIPLLYLPLMLATNIFLALFLSPSMCWVFAKLAPLFFSAEVKCERSLSRSDGVEH